MNAAVRAEALKMLRSPVGTITAVTLVLGLCGLLIVITYGASSGQPQLMAKLGPAAPDWAGLLAGAAQVVSVASLLACGVVVAWLFGREFADGTIVGLFALPVGRAPIAVAKLLVFLAWAVLVGLLLSVCVAVLGLVFAYGMPDSAVGESLLRLWLLTVLSGFPRHPRGVGGDPDEITAGGDRLHDRARRHRPDLRACGPRRVDADRGTGPMGHGFGCDRDRGAAVAGAGLRPRLRRSHRPRLGQTPAAPLSLRLKPAPAPRRFEVTLRCGIASCPPAAHGS